MVESPPPAVAVPRPALPARCRACQADYDASSGMLRCPGCDVLLPPHPQTSPFARLGLPQTWALDDAAVEQAWLKRCRLVHPDRFGTRPDAERRAAAEQTIAANDARRALRTAFDRAVWLVRDAGVDEPRLPQARLIAFMEAREDAEASAAGKVRVIDDAVARFAAGLVRLGELLGPVEWTDPAAHRPALASAAALVAELRTLGRLSADLGGPALIAGMDGR
jgi:DnaJ-domain-containing protein 1